MKYCLLWPRVKDVFPKIEFLKTYTEMAPDEQRDYEKFDIINDPPKYNIYREVCECDLEEAIKNKDQEKFTTSVTWSIKPISEDLMKQRVMRSNYGLIINETKRYNNLKEDFVFNIGEKIYLCCIDFDKIEMLYKHTKCMYNPVNLIVLRMVPKVEGDIVTVDPANIEMERIPEILDVSDPILFSNIMAQYYNQHTKRISAMINNIKENYCNDYEELIKKSQKQEA